MTKFTEEDIILRKVEHSFNKGVVKYRLIEDDDRILVGLSGGKDSLALLELLARRSKIIKPRFSVVAVHIVMTNIPYKSDASFSVIAKPASTSLRYNVKIPIIK